MTFLHKRADKSEELNDILDKVLSYRCMGFLSIHGVKPMVVISDDIKTRNIAEVKEATPVENVELECDVIIYISKEKTTNYSNRDFKVLITQALLMIEPTWRNDRPVLFVNKDAAFEVNPKVIELFGTDNNLYRDLFSQLKDIGDPIEPDKTPFRPMGDLRRS